MDSSRFLAVLRIGHRIVRDDRTTTHACLVARAFGASKIFIFDCDTAVKKTIDGINRNWGGNFEVEIISDWRFVVKNWRLEGGVIIHLTMYGAELNDIIDEVRELKKNVLIIIGAEKVPSEVYKISDYNISIGNQPHSEVAALAVFLDRFFRGEELKTLYMDTKYRIIPNKHNKQVKIVNENRI